MNNIVRNFPHIARDQRGRTVTKFFSLGRALIWPAFLQGGITNRKIALSGDSAGARTAYQDFFALWKDADPDIPILKEAKAEYAMLK
jgi:hypothetical protein